MTISGFLTSNELLPGLASAGFVLIVVYIAVKLAIRPKKPKQLPLSGHTGYHDPNFAEMVNSRPGSTKMSFRDFMGTSPDITQTRNGAMIGDKIATVTRSGKVYTGKCGSHEVVGFSIPEVLHELAEAVNREITANQ